MIDKSLAGLVIISIIVRLLFLLQEPLVAYTDSPYYLHQAESILSGNGIINNDHPLAFYYLVPFYLLFGPFIGFKIAISLAISLVAIPVYYIAIYLFKRNDIAILAAIFFLINPSTTIIGISLLKNSLGLAFGVSAFYFIFRTVKEYIENKPHAKEEGKAAFIRTILAVVFFTLAIYTHPFSTVSSIFPFALFAIPSMYHPENMIRLIHNLAPFISIPLAWAASRIPIAGAVAFFIMLMTSISTIWPPNEFITKEEFTELKEISSDFPISNLNVSTGKQWFDYMGFKEGEYKIGCLPKPGINNGMCLMIGKPEQNYCIVRAGRYCIYA